MPSLRETWSQVISQRCCRCRSCGPAAGPPAKSHVHVNPCPLQSQNLSNQRSPGLSVCLTLRLHPLVTSASQLHAGDSTCEYRDACCDPNVSAVSHYAIRSSHCPISSAVCQSQDHETQPLLGPSRVSPVQTPSGLALTAQQQHLNPSAWCHRNPLLTLPLRRRVKSRSPTRP